VSQVLHRTSSAVGVVYRGLSDSIVVFGTDNGESRDKGEGEEKQGPGYKCRRAGECEGRQEALVVCTPLWRENYESERPLWGDRLGELPLLANSRRVEWNLPFTITISFSILGVIGTPPLPGSRKSCRIKAIACILDHKAIPAVH